MQQYYFGPVYAIAVGGIGDLIGAFIIPFGPYFWGFTLGCALSGLIYGTILYKNPNKKISERNFIARVIIANVLVYGFISILLTPLWLNILYGKAYIPLLISRLSIQMIMLPLQIVLIYGLYKAVQPLVQKYLYEKEE